jgi:hypothetical protein
MRPGPHWSSAVQRGPGTQRALPQPQASQSNAVQISKGPHSWWPRQPGTHTRSQLGPSPQISPAGHWEWSVQPAEGWHWPLAQPQAAHSRKLQVIPGPHWSLVRQPSTQTRSQEGPSPQICPGLQSESRAQAGVTRWHWPLPHPQAAHAETTQLCPGPHWSSVWQPGTQVGSQLGPSPQIFPAPQSASLAHSGAGGSHWPKQGQKAQRAQLS